jgi:hypothetical protein
LKEESLAAAFGKEIKDVKKLEISVSSWRELAAEALGDLSGTCGLFSNAAFGERVKIAADWEKGAAARFLASDMSDIYVHAVRTLSGEGLAVSDLVILIEERVREIADSAFELDSIEALVKNTAQRLEELPLDMQTGKDEKAAETVRYFGRIGEKLFRIFFLLKSEGLSHDGFVIDDRPARVFVEEFGAALKELSAAYENRDTVLAGDIAEYELAPRLLSFYNALKNAA